MAAYRRNRVMPWPAPQTMPVIYLTNMSSIEEAFEESGRQVALTSVSDNDDDRLSRKLWTSDYLTGSLQGPATGDTLSLIHI